MTEREPLNITYETRGTYGEVSAEHFIQIQFLVGCAASEGVGSEPEKVQYDTGAEMSLAVSPEGLAELVTAAPGAHEVHGYRCDTGTGELWHLRGDAETLEVDDTPVDPDTPEGAGRFREMHGLLQAYVDSRWGGRLADMDEPDA